MCQETNQTSTAHSVMEQNRKKNSGSKTAEQKDRLGNEESFNYVKRGSDKKKTTTCGSISPYSEEWQSD